MATFEEVQASVLSVINEVTGVPLAEIESAKILTEDLDLDSLAIAEIGVAIGERLAIDVPDDAISGLHTVGDVINYAVHAQS